MRNALDCAQVRELIPELSAGVAPGDARASALAHIAGCAQCREELAATAAVVDDLLLLTPPQEPSPGFESKVLAALGHPPRRPVVALLSARRLRTVALRAAAVIVGIALAAGITGAVTWGATADDRRLAAQYRQTLAVADGRYLVAADVINRSGAEAGHAFAYEGRPSWVFVTLTSTSGPGPYALHVVTDDGRDIDTGAGCTVTGGTGGCGAAIDVPVRAIRQIELRAPGAPPLVADLS